MGMATRDEGLGARGQVTIASPFPASAWPRVWQWTEDFRWQVFDDFGPKTLAEFVPHCLERARVERQWAVYRDGELGGLVSFEPGGAGVGTSHMLFRKDFWGRDTTGPAIRMVYREIFASGVRKIVGLPFRGNSSLIGLAVELGARNEGLLRAQTMRRGKPVDVVVLGLLKEDFEKCLNKPAPVAA